MTGASSSAGTTTSSWPLGAPTTAWCSVRWRHTTRPSRASGAGLHEQQVLEQVHGVEADPAVIDGLEDLQRLGHVLGLDADQLHLVCQVPVVRAQLSRVLDELAPK